ncbi:MAG TPA: signal peptidase II [Gaiellaceae bacterium]|nr:signal peptidase II [Gaiellaceae bacterium]
MPISMVERSLTAGPFHWLGLLAIALSALAADQVTKQIVVTQLGLGESVHVVGPFWIRHVNNPGIAFGLFSSWASAVTFLTAAAVLWMLFYFAKSGARHPILPVALGLLIGGSLGNLVDRLRIGHVTDFLDLRYWPAFNLADTFIVVGVAALLLALVAAERQPRMRRTSSGRPAPKTSA